MARDAVKNAIDELNVWWPKAFNVCLSLITSDESFYSSFEVTAQEVINSQIGSYDIYIGLMWSRYGTPTRNGGSGTVEEFFNALTGHRDGNTPHLVSFYFCEDDIPINQIDPNQLSKLLEFKKNVQQEGYYKRYIKADDLNRKIRIDLSLWAAEKFIQHATDVKAARILPVAPFFHAKPESDNPWVPLQIAYYNFEMARQSIDKIGNECKLCGTLITAAKNGIEKLENHNKIARLSSIASSLSISSTRINLESLILVECFTFAVKIIAAWVGGDFNEDERLGEGYKATARSVIEIGDVMGMMLPPLDRFKQTLGAQLSIPLPSYKIAATHAIHCFDDVATRINIIKRFVSELEGLLSALKGYEK